MIKHQDINYDLYMSMLNMSINFLHDIDKLQFLAANTAFTP